VVMVMVASISTMASPHENTWDRNLITRNYTPVFPQLTESMQVSHAFEVMSDTITKVVGSSGALDSLICR
jgi:hypothetical protein